MDEGIVASVPARMKAAMLLVGIGPAGAAEVFKHLSDDLVERVTVEMVRTKDVPPEQMAAIQREVIENAYARGYMSEGGFRYAHDVLTRAVGEVRANEILRRLQTVAEATPFEFLRSTPPDQICAFLRGEHPQTTALVIANLPSTELAARVLKLIPADQQAQVALRIALMGQTAPDVVKEVAAVMARKLGTVIQQEYSVAGGIDSLADILNNSDRATERNILEHLADANAELAEEVRSKLFVFEDLLKLDARTMQAILKEIDAKELALALRGVTDEVKEHVLANMSQRAAEILDEEIELMQPQPRRVIEEAQSKVVAVVRRLEEAGTIFIARGAGASEDDMVL
jgi:flagellar motor switch protein FliG